MICKRAMERLTEAKNNREECIKYRICPDCGGSLTIITVVGMSRAYCTSCRSKFNISEQR